jgi:hypothetical protein
MADYSLYELHKITDNPQYEGFAFVRDDPLGDEDSLGSGFRADDRDVQGRSLKIRRLASIWTAQEVIGRVRRFNDYPCVNLSIPAFSRRAVDVFEDYLTPNGELLPLISPIGEYYAYNITTVADTLDQEKSEIEWLDGFPHEAANVFEIERYECIPEKVAGLSIFRLIEMPTSVYVTQPFVDRVRSHGLKGFHFVKLWPLPEDVSWRDLHKAAWREGQKINAHGRQVSVKANTVVVFMALAKRRPSKTEKERFSKLMDELDGILYDASAGPDSTYLGSLETSDYDKSTFRLFITCPDADALVDKLRPWLMKLNGEAPVRVLKRYGEYVDPDCREEWVGWDDE